MEIIHLVLGKGNYKRMNGVNRIAHNLAHSQHLQGQTVSLWGITFSPEENTVPRVYRTRFFQAYTNKLRISKVLKKAIYALPKSTVFHIHGAFIPEFYLVTKLLKRRGIAYIFTPHGPYNAQAMKKNYLIKTIYFKFFESSLLKSAKLIQLSGASEKENLDKMFSTDTKQIIIPNGQNREEIEFEFKPLEKQDRPVLGYCGRLATMHKGLDLLAEGFKMYKVLGGKGVLWLIGDGPDKNNLQKQLEPYVVSGEAKFYGALYGQEKLNIMANMDAFFHTSRFEGMPTSVMEAATLKLPCMVSQGTNVANYIDEFEAGIVIDPNTPEQIAQTMLVIEEKIINGSIKIMKENADKLAHKVFDWDEISKRLIDLYTAA